MRYAVDFKAKPEYSQEYLKLHEKFDVPLSGLTADQTRFRHYAFRNEINVFFRKCDLSGETIMSQFPQSSPFKVYRHDLWWQEEFEVPSAEYNPSESFFTQFRRLQLQVPRMSLACDSTMVNSPYVNCANHCKDCYMIFASGNNEACYYCINTERSAMTMNASIAHGCTLCHEITSCRNCYNLDYSAYCVDCSDSQFLFDCRRTRNCFLCVGLIGKEYCILNKQYTKEEYEQELKKYLPITPEKIAEYYERIEGLRLEYVHKYANIIGSADCTGNDISFSERCFNSFIVEDSQDCVNGSSLRKCKDCLDFDLWGDPGELCYNSMSCGYGVYYLRMSFDCWNNCRFLTYCDSCPGSENCFGCIGLKRRKFCILNRQYSEKEYGELTARIIEDMKARGEWGQFFPPSCSPYPLNHSMAREYFEVDSSLARELGFEWADEQEERRYDPAAVYKGSMLASEVSWEDLKSKVLLCSRKGMPYNIQFSELELLKRKALPLPHLHWRERFKDRDARFMYPWKLGMRRAEDTGRELLSPVPEKYKVMEGARG